MISSTVARQFERGLDVPTRAWRVHVRIGGIEGGAQQFDVLLR
jgi:hypothetical protein